VCRVECGAHANWLPGDTVPHCSLFFERHPRPIDIIRAEMLPCSPDPHEMGDHYSVDRTTEAETRPFLRPEPQVLGFASHPVASSLFFALLITSILPANKAAGAQSDLQTLLEQARTDEKAGNYVAAERVYEQGLALAPENVETLKRLGVLEQTELKFGDSIELFKRVLARDAQYPETNFFLGVSYFGENDFAQATQSFERELATPNPHPRCRYYLALALQSSGRIDEAISQLNRAVAENPKDADALYELARIYKNASVQAIERLKTLDPNSFQLHALMGEVFADEERYSEAVKEYQAALVKRPDARGIHYAIGIAYWAQHQMDLAEKEFQDAWKEDPNDALTNLYLGDIAVHERRFAEALGYLRVAQKGQPGMPQVHLLLGKCYRGQNDPEKAKAEFMAAIDADPADAQPHYLLAQVYRELHNPQASADQLAQFERLSKLEKDKAP
jgi:tetratricopeptide (TPR) repeat protein